MNIANISIKRPVFISVVMIVLTILGYVCYEKLALNDMPNADLPYVSVSVTETGASPESIETNITKQVEDAVQQISGVQNITSTVTQGSSRTMIEFDLSTDGEVAAQQVRDKVSQIAAKLPSDANTPVVSKFDMSATSILSIAVYGSDDNKEMSDFVDNTLEKKLYTVSGVGAVNVSGEDTREIHIKLDDSKLLQYGITSNSVVNSIPKDNVDQSGGKVTDGNDQITITTTSKIQKVDDFKNILVATKNGKEIRVKDIATIEDGVVERTSNAYYQGNPAIGIDIVKQSGSNTVEVARDVKTVLNQLKESLPKNMHVEIVSDNSTSIQDTVNDVMKTIIEGCALAVIIVFIFLNEWESTLISASSLPISIITTFICMREMNFSLNTMSLMAMSLAVGLLIDDAIVVIENIVRHLHMGKNPMEAARDATAEIGFAVIATTSAVIAVFFPLAVIEGILGKYFIEFSLTIVFSMAVSLFVSFTLVPMMSSKMLRAGKKESKTFIGKFFRWFNDRFDALANKYSHILAILLHKRLIVLAVCIAMFVGSIGLIKSLGFAMMPSTDQGQITVSATFDSGITLDTASKETKQLEAIIKNNPEVQYMYSTVSNSSASIKVTLVDKSKRKDSSRDMAEKLRGDFNGLPGMTLTVSASSMGGGGGRSSKDVSFELVGADRAKVQAFAEKMKSEMAKDPQASDVGTNSNSGTPEVKVTVDRDKAADLGVSPSDVSNALSTLFNGTTVTKYDNGTDRYDVKVLLQDDQRKNLNDLDKIYVSGSNNTLIPITQVTKKVIGTTSSTLQRYNKLAQVELSANVKGTATGTFQNTYESKIKNELPQGVSLSIGGSNGTMQKSMISMEQNSVLSILLLYLVMAAQFESFVDPIAIMFALPLAIIGAIVGLFVCGSQLSMVALIGIIMLMGLVAKNGILLIDAAKERIEEGMPRNEALVQAGLVRLRPIVMTTLAMIFGMIPTALATGAGTEMRKPMAEAIIGGLITSTILTLFVVPIVYTLLDGLKRRFRRIINRKKSIKLDSESNLEI